MQRYHYHLCTPDADHCLQTRTLTRFYFFFSSRRRHTRWPRDWSSDVCSSDLNGLSANKPLFHMSDAVGVREIRLKQPSAPTSGFSESGKIVHLHFLTLSSSQKRYKRSQNLGIIVRSEERRVGKECRARLTRNQ